MAKKEEKTNVMRALDKAHIPYRHYAYPVEDGHIDGAAVAAKLGQNPEQVVIPVAKELDLKAAARAVGEKSVSMIPVAEINRVTGYIRGGCSPIGMKKLYPTVVDESCLGLTTIIFSAGRIGAQVEVAPQDLLGLIRGKTAPITAHPA